MILLLKLAYRNIFRNFRRSLLTFFALTIGVALSLVFIGFNVGAERQSINLSVRTNTGHVKIYRAGFIADDLNASLDYAIGDYESIISAIQTQEGLEGLAARIIFPASLIDGIDELKLNGIGIDPEQENMVFGCKDKLLKGAFFEAGDESVLLTDEIARLFSLEPGDFITVMARTKYGAINAIDLEIAGIIDTGNPAVDNQNFFIPLPLARSFLEMQDMVTEIAVRGTSLDDAEHLAGNLRAALSGRDLDVVTWKYMNRDIIRLYEIRKKARWLTLLILFLMASASVMNTMLMAIFERTTEIGAIMAMGFRRTQVLLLFIFEGMFLGAFGSLIGCVLGGGITYYLKFHGINISQFSYMQSGNMNMPIGKYIYTEITPEYIAAAFILGTSIAVVSAAYPAFRGSRLEPTDALRYV